MSGSDATAVEVSADFVAAAAGVSGAAWFFVAAAAAAGMAWWVDGRAGARTGVRRFVRLSSLTLALLLVVFLPLAVLASGQAESGADAEASIATWELFWVHGVLALTLLAWYAAGEQGPDSGGLGLDLPRAEDASFPSGDGVTGRGEPGSFAGRVVHELLLGTLFGVAGWVVVLLLLALLGTLVLHWFGPDSLPQTLPEPTVLLASTSVAVRVGIALSAGVFEEIFFRSLLQPRVGILVSTTLFVAAHAGYGQPLVLVGITLLSLLFAVLRQWRGSVYAAIAAHTTFDLIQLLWTLPRALG